MGNRFNTSPEGRMNFRAIAREVRQRSGNRQKPHELQISNALEHPAYCPHPQVSPTWKHLLVPATCEHLQWDEENSITIADAELWIPHLVLHFAALQAEEDDRKKNRMTFERERFAHLKKVGYTAFQAEFDALHEQRRTQKDVDGWLLRTYSPATRDEELCLAEKTYTDKRIKSTKCPWLVPFRKYSGVKDFASADRKRLWPDGL